MHSFAQNIQSPVGVVMSVVSVCPSVSGILIKTLGLSSPNFEHLFPFNSLVFGAMGALQGEPGGPGWGPSGPWPTQDFGWVGHNAFGPSNNWPVCIGKLLKLVPPDVRF